MQRYAIYFTPQGAFGAAGAAWLGWDIARGCPVAQPQVADLDLPALTEKPRRYGFHATIKPPFALASGRSREELKDAFTSLCATLAPVRVSELRPEWMGGFLALTARGGDPEALTDLAATCVRALDGFRAPLTDAELARRDHPRLSELARRNLRDWGYPHVMEAFRFHLTLTGRVPRSQRVALEAAATRAITKHAPHPFDITALTLVGEGADGFFREILRQPLGR